MYNTMITLPDEILIHILQFLNYNTLSSYNLRLVSKHFSSLRRFAVLEIIVNDEIRKKNSDELIEFLSLFPNLKHLESIEYRGYNINNTVIKKLSLSCRQLEHLGLCNCHRINDECLNTIKNTFGRYSNIKTLNLAGCNQITDNGLRYLPGSLRYLVLTACDDLTDNGMQHIAESCQQLKRLHLAFLDQITDDGVNAIVQSNASTLETLDISECVRISDQLITHDDYGLLKNNIKNLKELNIERCPLVSDSGIESLTQISTLRRVKCERYGINSGLKQRLKENRNIDFVFT